MIPEDKCGLSFSVQDQLTHVFQKYSQIEKVILYGSRAKGNYRAGSDIDITIVAPKMDLSGLLQIQNEIDDLLLPYKMDISLFHQIDNANLLDHIQRVGAIFYSQI